jgi:thymidylate kinase
MSWIILEGLDKTGKSSVAEAYRKQGYEVYHMSAPSKDFTKDGYTGPSYLDELVELYIEFDGRDIIFDRSAYGELVWPTVYGRKGLLLDEDFEILKEFEDKNKTQRFLMIDPNKEAHWQRCVENKEPLNSHQFRQASILFNRLAHGHNFIPRELNDFKDLIGEAEERSDDSKPEDVVNPPQEVIETKPKDDNPVAKVDNRPETKEIVEKSDDPIVRLERANAINKILSSKIIRIKGPMFEDLEAEVRGFLKNRLSTLLGEEQEDNFSKEEVEILKVFVNQLKNRQKEQ